jgi:hypothetical protein
MIINKRYSYMRVTAIQIDVHPTGKNSVNISHAFHARSVGKCLATVMRECVMCRPDARLQIHGETNSHACSWPKPPEVRDIGVLCVCEPMASNTLMGMRPSTTDAAEVDGPRRLNLKQNM